MARVMLRNVTKLYGKSVGVRDLSFTVNDGEFFVILGPSGCGKTTALRLIAGLEEVTSGEIYIGHRLVNSLPPHERKVAMVFESPTYGLYPHMTAYDNMAFGLRIRKEEPPQQAGGTSTGKKEGESPHASAAAREAGIRERVEGVAGKLGLGRYLQRKEKQLSGGHRQSLALGRSMVQHPDLFLMDCPLTQIDPVNRMSARAEIRRQHIEMGTTTIYVTHDQEEAMALGDHIAVMNEGAIEQVGTAQGLYAHPATAFVASFIGSPPMNLIPANIEVEGDNAMYLRGRGFRVRVPEHVAGRLSERENSAILLGLRPEAIKEAQRALSANPETLVSGQVTLREYTGSEVYLHVAPGDEGAHGDQFVARAGQQTSARPSDRITVAFDMEQLYAFDPTTGHALL